MTQADHLVSKVSPINASNIGNSNVMDFEEIDKLESELINISGTMIEQNF